MTSSRQPIRQVLAELASDSRVPPVAFTCLAFVSVVIGANLGSIPWIGATLLLDLCALVLWGRPTLRLRPAPNQSAQQERMRRVLVTCLPESAKALEVDCLEVEGEPFADAFTTVTRSSQAGTVFFRREQVAAMSEAELRVMLTRETVHLVHRNDVRRWAATAVTLFLLVAGSGTLGLLRLCLRWRVGAVDLLGSVAACFVGIPTAVFLLQYVLHELEYQADREVVRREPALAPVLVDWLQREGVHRAHPFVVIPLLEPTAAERVAHLRRFSGSNSGTSLSRPASAVGAVGLLLLIALAVSELVRGRVPDVALNAGPANEAKDAIASAQSVREAIAAFTRPARASQAQARLQQAAEEVEALRAKFDRYQSVRADSRR
jgi:hypothetical protein